MNLFFTASKLSFDKAIPPEIDIKGKEDKYPTRA